MLNFSTLTFITNARTTMPFARLHSQMVCTQSEPAEIPHHMFVQILVQVGGDRKWRTSRTTLRTPTPLVIRHCFLVYCVRTWKVSFPPYLQMSETQIANHELLHGNLCGSQHFLFEHCTTLQSIERIWNLSRPARTIKRSKMQISLLKNGFKPGSSLSRTKAGNCTTDCHSPDTLSLSLLFLKSDLLDALTYTIPHTH